jgi:hypothetical protein
LSHAPPLFARWYARNRPLTTAPMSTPATAVGPSSTPVMIGAAKASFVVVVAFDVARVKNKAVEAVSPIIRTIRIELRPPLTVTRGAFN